MVKINRNVCFYCWMKKIKEKDPNFELLLFGNMFNAEQMTDKPCIEHKFRRSNDKSDIPRRF